MEIIDDLLKACSETTDLLEEIRKSHVKQYTRADGTVVQEHDDSRKDPSPRSNLDHPQMKAEIKHQLAKHKAAGYKVIDEQHTDDGIAVDADKAEHHHYFMEDKDGNRAAIYHHTQRNSLHTVGTTKDGKVPMHPTGTKYLQAPEKWGGDIRKSQMALDFGGGHDHHVAYSRTNASGTVSQIQAKGAPKVDPVKHEHYPWGRLTKVEGKGVKAVLHPEHQEIIGNLQHGQSATIKDEQGINWKATRDGDHVKLQAPSIHSNKPLVAAHADLKPELPAAVPSHADNVNELHDLFERHDKKGRGGMGISTSHPDYATPEKMKQTIGNILKHGGHQRLGAAGAKEFETLAAKHGVAHAAPATTAPKVTTTSVSGTKAGWIHGLSQGGTLQRDIDIKGAKYPKGATVHVLPGGVFIHHDGVKRNPSVGSQWDDKYGQGVQRTEENLNKLAAGMAAPTADETHAAKKKQLLDGVHKVGNDLLNNPKMAEHHENIKRKLEALKANPSTKAAANVVSDLKLMAEKVKAGGEKEDAYKRSSDRADELTRKADETNTSNDHETARVVHMQAAGIYPKGSPKRKYHTDMAKYHSTRP